MSYLVDLRKEARADLLHVKVVQTVQRGDGVSERLAGRSGAPLRARILKRFARAHRESVHGTAFRHLRGPPRWIAALLPVALRRGGQLQLRGQILRQAAVLLQCVAADPPRPVLGRHRGDGEVTAARVILAGRRGVTGTVLHVDYPRHRFLMRVQQLGVGRRRAVRRCRRIIRARIHKQALVLAGSLRARQRRMVVDHLGRLRGR